MIKRLLCLVLAAVMAAALAACGDGDEPDATGAPTGNTAAASVSPTAATEIEATEPALPATGDEADPDGTDEKDGLDMKAFLRDFDRTAQITEQVVYDADGVRITALKLIYDSIRGAVVQFRAENQSASDLLIQTDTCAVNDYMMKAELDFAAPAGKTAEGEMVIRYPALALAGVTKIAALECTLRLMDRSTYTVMANCEPAVMQTTAFEGYEQSYEAEGQTAFDDGGVRIVLGKIDRGRQISDYPALIVYMFNGTDRAISVLNNALLVNGYELTPAMTTTVMPGKYAVDVVTFFDQDLEEHDIDAFDAVEISFRIVDEETWQTVAETETILLEEE